ncbi:MAG: O-antigen ligase family protein [Elusimicrobia bacterium]|nr:O-antigen ligase family protein [Elusimicrobiota bacterium]
MAQALAGNSGQETMLRFCRNALLWFLPILYLLISDSFYLRTYDSAQVKITLVQMGGLALLTLWLCLLCMEGWRTFRREDLLFLAPFLAFLVNTVISFAYAPHKGPSVDDFIRYIFYMSVAMMIIREFDEKNIRWLTRVLVWTTGICAVYGFMQWLDTRFFPKEGGGVDPFVWRGAFGTRIFSTFGNPNFFADFLVLIFPILASQYLKTRSVSLIPLMLVVIFDLYFSGTKGAWLGFAAALSMFILIYTYFFLREQFQRIKFWILGTSVLIPVASLCLVLWYLHSTDSIRMTSIRFRVQTWLATWEMIETHPWIGTGVGSFKVIYPAFRRPTIFIIEGKHNTETDHAEDEYLEEWFDRGILGFGIFLWLILSTCFIGFRSLDQLTLATKGSRPPPRAYDLLGYLVAFLGMMAHNFFDVSLRFVSSGVYFGLLPGVIINLSRGQGLSFPSDPTAPSKNLSTVSEASSSFVFSWIKILLIPFLKSGACGGLLTLIYFLCKEFYQLQGSLSQAGPGGETLQWWISWSIFLAVVLGLGYVFVYLTCWSPSPWVPCFVLLMLYPMYLFWGYFKADVHHNIAIYFSRKGNWDEALKNYLKVNQYNPYFMMAYYFKGNVFNDRFVMEKQYRPEWGDKKGAPRDDFERALNAYEEVRSLAPNYVQMHHQVGVMYMKRADFAMQHGDSAGAQSYLNQAMERFRLYRLIDPIFGLNYYRLAQIHLMRQEFDQAIELYQAHIKALKNHVWPYNRDQDLAESYAQMGNAYVMKSDWANAGKSYQEAFQIIPNFPSAQKGFEIMRQRAASPPPLLKK